MHRIWEFPVRHLLREEGNLLRILLDSPLAYIREKFSEAPTRGSEDAMDGFVHIRKAHCMFGWDWGAHLPDAGIFRPVILLGIQKACLDSVYLPHRKGGTGRGDCEDPGRDFRLFLPDHRGEP